MSNRTSQYIANVHDDTDMHNKSYGIVHCRLIHLVNTKQKANKAFLFNCNKPLKYNMT